MIKAQTDAITEGVLITSKEQGGQAALAWLLGLVGTLAVGDLCPPTHPLLLPTGAEMLLAG